ncbi:MAG: hypothetical protein QOE76_1554 [Frankiales bacterium]|jgi:hypothetical protein|nr:hypothetical protein [Frankiales bacterium]
MRVRRVTAVLCALGAALMAAGPAGAVVGSPAVYDTACITTPTAQFSPAPDGWVRGFLETGCNGDSIDYSTFNPGHNRGTLHVATPYKGQVLATTQDAQASYLLYRATDGVRIAKVLHDGTMTHGNLLSPAVGGGLEGTVAARGGTWLAIWTEPKASGGFGMHEAGSRNYVVSPKDRILPAGAGVDDSAPSLAAAATGPGFVLAFSRHTASGYHLLLAHSSRTWSTPREIDNGVENPEADLIRSGSASYLTWMHGRTVMLATTAGSSGPVGLHTVAVPQAPGTAPVTNPRVAISCNRLYVGFQAGSENSGAVFADTRVAGGAWVRHTVRVSSSTGLVLAGIAPHCASGAVMWTEAAVLHGAMVS